MRSRAHAARAGRHLLLLTVAMPIAAAHADDAAPASPVPPMASNGDIVVTATRQAQVISRVPISVSAYSQATMDIKGMKSFSDVARFTPGVRFDPDSNSISIRGIQAGKGGAGTTGIYIDDTPVQIRGLGFDSDDSLPAIFDLERVEVLRGPQGTLFGAGSEGGTVRFITPQPSLTTVSTYDRAELSTTAHGSPSWEVGSAVGVPIIQNTLGIRVSAWHRHDGGYIDHVNNQTGIVDAHDINYGDVTVVRGALAWQPAEGLMITPSMMFQRRTTNAWDEMFVGLSDPSKGVFKTSSPELRGSTDRYILPTLNIRYDFGGASLIGNSSYFRRHNITGYDGTIYNLSYYEHFSPYPLLTPTGILTSLPYYYSPSVVTNTQSIYTEELRLQSNNPNARLTWVVGAFYQHSKQRSSEVLYEPTGDTLFEHVFGESEEAVFGYPTRNGESYNKTTIGRDSQIAGFADASFEIVRGLKINGGVRYAQTKFGFNTNELGNYEETATVSQGKDKEHPVTPKVGLNWQVDRNNLLYATWAKGYRVGGANPPVNPIACADDLQQLGLTNAPETYKSDTVKSIELGSKNKLFGGKLQLAGSIYQVKWNGIQQNVYLSSCGLQFIANLGKARSRGFDLQATLTPARGLSLDAAVGYTNSRLTETISLGPGVTSARAGDAIEGAPWTISAGAEYQFPLAGHDFFMRGDVQYLSRLKTPTAGRDPANASSYNPGTLAPAARTNISLRAGAILGGANVSLFVDNLLDSAPQYSYAPIDSEAALFTETVVRPRVVGLTITYRR